MSQKLHGLVQAYWPVALGALAIAAAWGSLTTQNSAISKTVGAMNLTVTMMSADVAAIKATSEGATRDISDLRTRILAVETRRN